MEHLQYPIGRFSPAADYSVSQINQLIDQLKEAPNELKELVANLSETDLAKNYRTGSWNVRQLVHHITDLHLIYYLRLKKALTEDNYEATLIQMDDWANLPDATQSPVDSSLLLFTGINQRMVLLLQSLDEQALTINYFHPLRKIYLSLKQTLYMIMWHFRHHQAHIVLALGGQPKRLEF